MNLVCTKCGSGSRIEHEGNDLHCKFCGNVVVEGVTPRWPIIEKEVFDAMKKKCRKCNKKNALVNGLCYGCYKEEHGHAYTPEKHRGEKKVDPAEEKQPPVEKPEPHGPPDKGPSDRKIGRTVVVNFTDYPDLYEALTKEAKDDFRTPDAEILYLIRTLIKAGEAA